MPTPRASWTCMVYLAGDNNLDSAGVTDINEMKQVGSSNAVNIVAQFDRQGRSAQTRRFYLRKGTTVEQDVVAEIGETNTGDPKVLKDFVQWAVTNYPAQRYLLVLWNHGSGWDDTNIYDAARADAGLDVTRRGTVIAPAADVAQGSVSLERLQRIGSGRKRRSLFRSTILESIRSRAIAFDDAAQDFLDNVELKRVMASIKKITKQKIDVLGMDACLMNMLEVGFQLRSSAALMVGSEELEPGDGWPYHTILAELVARPNMDGATLAKLIVKKYIDSYPASEPVTQSALDLDLSDEVLLSLDKLAQVLLEFRSNDSVSLGLFKARQKVQSYYVADYVDLGDLCKSIKKNVRQSEVVAACDGVLTSLKAAVLANGHKGRSMAHSTGISIYYPLREMSPLYARLDSAKKASWDEFLRAVLA